MTAIFWAIDAILNIYWWIVILSVVLSWLYAFNVVNPGNQFVRAVGNFIHEATEPFVKSHTPFHAEPRHDRYLPYRSSAWHHIFANIAAHQHCTSIWRISILNLFKDEVLIRVS